MLRITVIALVVANLILFGFEVSKPAKKPADAQAHAERPAASPGATDPGIPTVHLYSEIEDDPDLMAGARHCYTLGPFHSSAGRDAVRARIEPLAAAVSERRTEAMVEKGYWVFLPPYTTLAEASGTLRALKSVGVRDVGVLYDGEHAGGISLGYFLLKKNALKRKRSIEAKGYRPQMQMQRQAEPRFWLDYELLPGAGLPALDVDSLPVDFTQRTVPCGAPEVPAGTTGNTRTPVERESSAPGQGVGAGVGAENGSPAPATEATETAAGGKEAGIAAGSEEAGPEADRDSGAARQGPATVAKPDGDDGEPAAEAGDTVSAGDGAETTEDAEDLDSKRPSVTKGPPH